MTTELSRQPGIPPADYPGHVNSVLSRKARQRSRRWMLWAGLLALALALACLGVLVYLNR